MGRWKSDDFTADDVFEIHLSNPYSFGNPRAYSELLGNIYICNINFFDEFMLHNDKSDIESIRAEFESADESPPLYSGQPWRVMGVATLVASALLLGIAISDALQGSVLGPKIVLFGFFGDTMSICMILDTSDVSLWSRNIAQNTYGAQLCRMLSLLLLSLIAASFLRGKLRNISLIGAAVGSVAYCAVLIAIIFGHVPISRTLAPWVIVQAAALCATLICAVLGFQKEKEKNNRVQLGFLLVLLCSALLEICNGWFGWWTRGMEFNSVFLLSFAAALIWMAKSVPAQYKAAKHYANMKLQLAESRIAIMLSQIQPHFLYNTLSTIRALCRRDPATAEQAIIEFTEFLRGNMDSLTADKPISFEQELSHTKNYLALEKMRFSKKLNVEYDIQTTMFRMPTLTLQPIVENAVRYGITKRVKGGTLTISTKETNDAFVVTVTDDGVGFDPIQPKEDGRTHIGILNVSNRLSAMCGGSLRLDSTPNVGTTAVITIPKEKN